MAQNDKKSQKNTRISKYTRKAVYTRFTTPADEEHVEEEGRKYGGRPEYIRELVRQDRIIKKYNKKP